MTSSELSAQQTFQRYGASRGLFAIGQLLKLAIISRPTEKAG